MYWADPSGADSAQDIIDAWNKTPNGGSSTWYNDGNGGFTDEEPKPKEGQSRIVKVVAGHGHGAVAIDQTQYYHAGGGDINTGFAEARWYSESEYFGIFRTVIRDIGQGKGSIESLNDYGFTDGVYRAMIAWAAQAYSYYGGKPQLVGGGLENNNIIFDILTLRAPLGTLSKLSNRGKFAFWSGRGTEAAAKDAGFKVLGQTRAGQNLANLTANMSYVPGNPGSQAYQFWGRLSQALARTIPKNGTAHIFITKANKANPLSVWNKFEKPILLQNNVTIKYHIIK